MLPGEGKHCIIISSAPVMQCGLKAIVGEYRPDYEFSFCRSPEALTLLQLRCALLVIADLSSGIDQPGDICEYYHSLMIQYQNIHWVFMAGDACYPLAVELLMRSGSTLISNSEPVNYLIDAICPGGNATERVSEVGCRPERGNIDEEMHQRAILTFSERKVLRLLAKGWGINQIAALLKKSNKTISAQKNSAMRRLSLRSNAEMYAWINSVQGMRTLNIDSANEDRQNGK
ncbi:MULTISPECIES: LuxR C-terminal-related transcriptional regulator [Klebsiella]|uniref:LuxR C-terminal-related transcriptional regulator n=1 Tax=Klebsiella TaxID=570 RepID=UPI00374FFD7E